MCCVTSQEEEQAVINQAAVEAVEINSYTTTALPGASAAYPPQMAYAATAAAAAQTHAAAPSSQTSSPTAAAADALTEHQQLQASASVKFSSKKRKFSPHDAFAHPSTPARPDSESVLASIPDIDIDQIAVPEPQTEPEGASDAAAAAKSGMHLALRPTTHAQVRRETPMPYLEILSQRASMDGK